MFDLHPQLAADTAKVADLRLCRVLLMKDARYPWLILTPRKNGLTEIHHLPSKERALLMEEIAFCAQTIETLFAPDKINIGALGNLVPQLHIHIIGRRTDDPAWPGPVWGVGKAIAYEPEEFKAVRDQFIAALADG